MSENNNILEKLEGLESRFEEVSLLITDPNVIEDQPRYVKLTKEYKDLGDIMEAKKRYVSCLNSIAEAKDLLANESDPEMKEMAREELSSNENLRPKLEEEIKIALVPKDPEDEKNVQMEIRAGAGGDEAALFAGDLFSMYKRFCESKGWTVSVTNVSEGAVGGFKGAARVAIAQRKDGIVLFLVTEGNHSSGPTMGDITDTLLNYGAYNAANLDGGASSQLAINGELINNPKNIYGQTVVGGRSVVSGFGLIP